MPTTHIDKTGLITASQAMAPFDQEHPGRGFDQKNKEIADHAMAYALYASSACLTGDLKSAQRAGNWLVANSAHGTAVGWGLPFAWDAFRDGSVNPVSTVYGITTAFAVRALLDVYEATGIIIYADAAQKALEYYRQFFKETPQGGYFYYSDQKTDDINSLNVSSMLMGQYARAAALWPNYREVADKAFRLVWGLRKQSELGMDWPYSDLMDRPNDVVHAAYIVQGLLDYAEATGRDLEMDQAIEYLGGFISDQGVYEFNEHPGLASKHCGQPARLWGVGMLIYTLAYANQLDEAVWAARALPAYEFAPGRLGNHPGDSIFLPRAQGHVTLGLALLEKKLYLLTN